MATKINQKEYLKKYLSGDKSADKKKKKKKAKSSNVNNVRIIDDDIDISKLQKISDEDLEVYAIGEDAPQIVGVFDERPAELIAKEDYKNSERWKVLASDDGTLTVNNFGHDGKMKSSNRGAGGNKSKTVDKDESSRWGAAARVKQEPNNSDSDASPPRRQKINSSNASPPRRSRRRGSDASPPRRHQRRQSPPSPPPPCRRQNDSDASPPRRRRRDSTDASPKRRHRHNAEKSPPPRRRSSRDMSPQRRRKKLNDDSPDRKRRRRGSDASPPRRRHDSDSDASPPRKRRQSPPQRRRHRDSADASPPRRQRDIKLESKKLSRWSRDRSVEPAATIDESTGKMSKTLDGKSAGLQNAKDLRKESDKFRKREEELFSKMTAESSGRNAEAVVRDRRTGRIRDIDAEMEIEHEKMRKEQERKAVYDRWGKGVKQVEEHQARMQEHMHESNKPLARFADDKDLDEMLRHQSRDGDPMLEYLRNKEQAKDAGKPSKPIYQGMYPENRFGIRPGYRWDGVDRSNGFEVKWFDVQSKKKAGEEEAYKYSVEDM